MASKHRMHYTDDEVYQVVLAQVHAETNGTEVSRAETQTIAKLFGRTQSAITWILRQVKEGKVIGKTPKAKNRLQKQIEEAKAAIARDEAVDKLWSEAQSERTIDYEKVTKTKARQYLRASYSNRLINAARVASMAWDLRNGKWHTTHQGIAFEPHGRLIDGQHRLMAIIETGIPIIMPVARGVPVEAIPGIDQGQGRTPWQQSKIMGYKHPAWYSSLVRSVTQAIHSGEFASGAKPSTPQSFVLIDQYIDALDFCRLCIPKNKRKITPLIIRMLIVKAYYTCKKNDTLPLLQEFCETLVGGIATKKYHQSAIKLRDYLLTNEAHGSQAWRRQTYQRAQTCLKAFLNRRAITYIRKTTIDLFPLPGKRSAATAAKKGK